MAQKGFDKRFYSKSIKLIGEISDDVMPETVQLIADDGGDSGWLNG